MTRWHPLPAEVCALVQQTPATVLLEGRRPHRAESGQKPWTQLFVAPLRICAAYTALEIPALFADIENAVAAGQCAAGFFTYECGTCFEPKATTRPPREGQPLAWFGIYERSYAFDHVTGTFSGGEPPELERLKGFSQDVSGHEFTRAKQTQETTGALAPEIELAAEFALTEADYARRIAAIHEFIRAGDVYQLNFTAPLRFTVSDGAADLYARLRTRQPVDYGALIHWEQGHHILSFSPELFFRVDHDSGTRRIVTRPMKGTAPRGCNSAEDCLISEWLRNDAKNRAENLMIVDLLRNDLGRIARFGTVRVEDLFAVERYATLWQMTSTIRAELRPDIGFHDIFRALFPSGSITGAPKVRAMQLIAELEDAPRSVYTGAIGFFSPQQTIFNVAIRTLELDGDRGAMGVGSGIVIDSNPEEEFRECRLKTEFLTRPANRWPQRFSLIETMLWDGDYPLLELHLDRLVDSAEYFEFTCDRTVIRAALQQHAQQFSDASPRRVRLLVDSFGKIQISVEAIATAGDSGDTSRARISPERTDPADPMLFHKTTHRPLYAAAFQQAVRDGFIDVLFLNQRGEVTEGAISNIFIVKDGRWLTPPDSCGLLPGVYRRYLLETRRDIRERVLSLDDLRSADAIYLTNAVRGLRRVTIAW